MDKWFKMLNESRADKRARTEPTPFKSKAQQSYMINEARQKGKSVGLEGGRTAGGRQEKWKVRRDEGRAGRGGGRGGREGRGAGRLVGREQGRADGQSPRCRGRCFGVWSSAPPP